ncbi:MAG: DUF6339 family protein [Candidatus Woesearchaeota archaeon]
MGVQVFNQSSLDKLKNKLEDNLEFYTRKNFWLNDFFQEDDYYIQLEHMSFNFKEINLLPKESKTKSHDYENIKKIYNNLKNLDITLASDERFWAYLTHNVFWKYMKTRWPKAEDYFKKEKVNKAVSYLKSRYFFGNHSKSRQLVRNGISRLWWAGYLTYDESFEDPYTLTKILTENQDMMLQFLETAFCRNKDIARAVLKVFNNLDKKYRKGSYIKKIIPHLNRIGGVSVLDILDKEKLEDIIIEKILEIDDELENKEAV